MKTKYYLAELRKLIKKQKLDAYLVPSADPHASEYLPEYWKRRHFITGFTGSAGDAAITLNSGGLWTDSRYFVQAEIELKGSGLKLMKMGMPGTPSIPAWLGSQLKKNARIGFDPQVLSQSQYEQFKKAFAAHSMTLVRLKTNLVDQVWQDRPSLPEDPVEIQPIAYAGETVYSKLRRLRKALKEKGATAHVIGSLDVIAWLFNIRGRDIAYNPFVVSYALITETKAYLFTDLKKVSKKVKHALGSQVELRNYDSFESAVSRLGKRSVVLFDPDTTSHWIATLIPKGIQQVHAQSPVVMMRAMKNDIELRGAVKAHVRDGVAVCKFLHWLEEAVPTGAVDEINAAEKLAWFRAKSKLYRGDSFDPIVGYAEHGAIVHYSASPESCAKIRARGMLLLDTGGQYQDGTTDITRTITFGKPTREQKEHFTRVLKGHIGIAMSSFPDGVSGGQIDAFARRALWDAGINYGHGTGHGVGSYLGVHEGPHRISPMGFGVPLKPGMIMSNEPGSYLEGKFGVRIENLIYVVVDKEKSTSGMPFYRFENLTLCPIDTRLVDKKLMTADEIRYLNDYHALVRKKLLPHLKGADATWLRKATKAI